MAPMRKDPAGFKTTEMKNARTLAGLVKDFEELFLRVLDGKAKARALGQRELVDIGKIPEDIYLKLFDAVDTLEKFIDGNPSEIAAEKIVTASTSHGVVWADKNLGNMGVATLAPTQSNAKPFYLPPEKLLVDMYNDKVMSEIKGLTSYQATALKRELMTAFNNGETIGQITRRVRDVTGKSISKSITIARTETLAAGNAAARSRYRSAGIEMVEWVAALDDAVCKECESEHGNTYPIDEAPDLPVHPNCRCTLIPLVPTE